MLPLVLASIVAQLPLRAPGGPLPAAEASRSLSNVKQIGLAMLLYSADHKDTFPKAKKYKAAIMPYVRNKAVFTAPGAPLGTLSYFMEPRLSGMKITSIANPAETALIVQGSRGKAAFPYRGRTAMGYVDGHAKLTTLKAAVKARTLALK